jgi:DNA-binding XRE family transcriptional regulator
LVLKLFGHFGRDQFGMICQKLLPVRESGVANREGPKEDSQWDSNEGDNATTGDEVENSVEDEAAPFLPRYKINGRHEDYTEIHHMIFLSIWLLWFRSLNAAVWLLYVPTGTYQVKPVLRYSLRVAKSNADVIGSAVARLLREKREALGLSNYIIAKRAGISHSTLIRIEKESRKPSLYILLRVAEAMEISLGPLIKEAENQSAKQNKKNP